MSLSIVEDYITKINKGSKGANTPKFIVFHFVGASGQAMDNAKYFHTVYREASAHYFVDPNRIIRVVPDDTPAWHIGDGSRSGKGDFNGYFKPGMATNNNSIGVELCQDTSTGRNAWEWQFHPETLKKATALIKDLQEKYGIPDSRVIRHFDASGKHCPGNWMANNWAKWKDWKTNMLPGYTSTENVAAPKNRDDGKAGVIPNTYVIKVGDTLSKIAKEHGVTVDQIVKWNEIDNPNLIFPESRIFVKEPLVTKQEPAYITQKGKRVPKKGSFKFSETVNVRNQPAAYGPIPAQYKPGQVVNYDNVSYQNGHIWLHYTSYSGKSRYISAGTPTVAYGTFI